MAVCLEPSDNRLSLGACGSLHAKLTFHGRAAHSARPWQGENAIHKAASLLADVGGRPARVVTVDGLEYRTVTTVTLASGGHSRNSVPDRFTLNVNHRFSPNQTLAQAERDVLDLVAGRAELEWVDRCPGARPEASHPLVEALRNAGVAGVEAKQAWTDVARFAELGVTAVNFGPGLAAQAHQSNEWASLTQLEAGRTILASWLAAIGAR
jgi:succinyl-diaminopimelate desuccinylase